MLHFALLRLLLRDHGIHKRRRSVVGGLAGCPGPLYPSPRCKALRSASPAVLGPLLNRAACRGRKNGPFFTFSGRAVLSFCPFFAVLLLVLCGFPGHAWCGGGGGVFGWVGVLWWTRYTWVPGFWRRVGRGGCWQACSFCCNGPGMVRVDPVGGWVPLGTGRGVFGRLRVSQGCFWGSCGLGHWWGCGPWQRGGYAFP